ncbi:MAG: hypothetical protein ACRDPG_03080 [Nocardioidaceae bacterium]
MLTTVVESSARSANNELAAWVSRPRVRSRSASFPRSWWWGSCPRSQPPSASCSEEPPSSSPAGEGRTPRQQMARPSSRWRRAARMLSD